MTVRTDLNGTSYQSLREDARFAADIPAFENHTIRTVVIRHWPDNDFLFRVFLRLNTGSVPLSPQELRQALIPGPFLDFADEFASQDVALREALGLDKPDFRMRDTEMVVRHYAFRNRLQHYRGNLKAFLDDSCAIFNQSWVRIEEQVVQQGKDLSAAIDATHRIFSGEFAFVRYRGDDTENRFNRAVFDIMTYYFANDAIRPAALALPDEVRDAFFDLSLNDDEFDRSISTTTKSVRATAYRFVRWAEALNAVLPIAVDAPPGQVRALQG